MLAMTPFLLIATDSRIEELAQQMALPAFAPMIESWRTCSPSRC